MPEEVVQSCRSCKSFLIFLVSYFTLNAQNNIRISTPEVSFLNNLLTIKYDIAGCGTGDYINIKLIVLNAQGDTIKTGSAKALLIKNISGQSEADGN